MNQLKNGTWAVGAPGSAARLAAEKEDSRKHYKSSDCAVNPETLCCDLCGVDHSEECIECGHRGYHAETCNLMLVDF